MNKQRKSLGKTMEQIQEEQEKIYIADNKSIGKLLKHPNILTKFIQELKAAGVKGTINLTIEI